MEEMRSSEAVRRLVESVTSVSYVKLLHSGASEESTSRRTRLCNNTTSLIRVWT